MKGSRAKRHAEEAAASTAPNEAIAPPNVPREGVPRPGPVVGSGEMVMIPDDAFKKLCSQLRTNEILGAAAADALEAAAGLRPVASPQSKMAKDLRSNVADTREEDGDKPKKKKAMNFADGPVDEIPDGAVVKRASVSEEDAADHDMENMTEHPEKDASEPPELNLDPKQNGMRTKLEMWVMDEIPILFGVDDSEELDEDLQEDCQAAKVTFLIAEKDEDGQVALVDAWLKDAPNADDKAKFAQQLLEKVRAIQALSPKKKKKKKKGGEES